LARDLVSRFKHDIRVWELGNELENYAIIQPCEVQDDGVQYNCAWGPAGGVGPLEYFGPRWQKSSAVLKGLSDGAMAADPTVRKAMGTAGWGHVGAFERMLQDGIRWDISVWHMYGDDPEWAFKHLVKYGKPIWITELNHPLGSQYGEIGQAEGIGRDLRRVLDLRASYPIEAVHIYELLDEPYWAPDFEAFMGLVAIDKASDGAWKPGRTKPAYDVVKRLIANRTAQAAPARTSKLDRRSRQDDGIERRCALDRNDPSPATVEQQIAYGYCLILGRNADGGGLRDYADAVGRGTSIHDVLGGMMASDEFAQVHATTRLDNGGFVTRLFKLLLGRPPDGAGIASYLAQLDAGIATRIGVATSIIHSEEFANRHPILAVEQRTTAAKR
jgi:hypothetical protein